MFSRPLLLVTLLAIASAAIAQMSPKDVFKKASPSVVLVLALDKHNQPLAFGTGFYVEANLVATNFHVIEGATNLAVFAVGKGDDLGVEGVRGIDTKRDLALIQVKTSAKPLDLAPDKCEVGETVYAIGNPRGLEATLSSGLVSGIREAEDPKMYQVTAPISSGSSGGPVLRDDGKVIGVATSSFEDGQNLNFAVQATHLRDLIASKGSLRPMSDISGEKLQENKKTAEESVRIVQPEWDSMYKGLEWDLTIANDGDRELLSIDLLILVYDKTGQDLIHFHRTTVRLRVPPKLARRTHLEAPNLGFEVNRAYDWMMVYRVLRFEVAKKK